MARKAASEVLAIDGREVTITNAAKVLFPAAKITKLDVARYYIAVAEGALRGAGGRPNMLVRYPNGIEGEFFYQKRAPHSRPSWIEVVSLRFPSGRSAEEVVPRDAAALAWLLRLAGRHEREGLGDAPWPPHYRKQSGEPPRVQPSRRRTPKHPLIEIARAQRKDDALAGLERWRARHPEAAAHLAPADVLVDAMRCRFHTWPRILVNLQHVPEI